MGGGGGWGVREGWEGGRWKEWESGDLEKLALL